MHFSQLLESLRVQESHGEITIGDDWLQGRATFGGVVAGVCNEVMRRFVPHDRPIRSLQTTFVGPASPGLWHVDARVMRVGKAVTLAQCELRIGDQVAATQVGVYGGARRSAVAFKPQSVAVARNVEDLREVRFQPGSGSNFMQHFAVRWAEGAKPYSSSNVTHSQAFIRHRDPAPLSESHIVALVDCIPTPAFSMFAAPAPASSLVWTLEFFEHHFDYSPAEWWRIDTKIDAATDGYVSQTGVLNSPDGRPIALTRQLVAVFG
jgi:acyl-CoA thioesterase